jgi:serine/threonine protein kinase
MCQRQGTVQLSLAQVITLAADAAAALAFLHERGIAHRDVAGTCTQTLVHVCLVIEQITHSITLLHLQRAMY